MKRGGGFGQPRGILTRLRENDQIGVAVVQGGVLDECGTAPTMAQLKRIQSDPSVSDPGKVPSSEA